MTTTSFKSKSNESTKEAAPCLLQNVHIELKAPSAIGKTLISSGVYSYYHYGCDGQNDHGWGCAYRTLQTICSWIAAKQTTRAHSPPSITEIQKILANLECRPKDFVGSRTWIGAMEVFFVLDKLFDTKCRILHIPKGEGFTESNVQKLADYFERFAGICMMGGDTDASSKGIAGIHIGDKTNSSENEVFLLVIDPHYPRQPKSAAELIDAGYVRWQHITDFIESSFYNVCMPELE